MVITTQPWEVALLQAESSNSDLLNLYQTFIFHNIYKQNLHNIAFSCLMNLLRWIYENTGAILCRTSEWRAGISMASTHEKLDLGLSCLGRVWLEMKVMDRNWVKSDWNQVEFEIVFWKTVKIWTLRLEFNLKRDLILINCSNLNFEVRILIKT